MKIFFDVDTQNDFMNSDGALYVPKAESIKPNLKLLTDYARENKIPITGSRDKHFGREEYKEREGELQKWGGPFPEHCMAGTFGQEKIGETKTYADYPAIYFEKQNYDVFTNPDIEKFLKQEKVIEVVVYGVATDYCVKAAVFGMQKLGIQCYIVEDAIKGVFPDSTKIALEEMLAKGAKFIKTTDILENKIK